MISFLSNHAPKIWSLISFPNKLQETSFKNLKLISSLPRLSENQNPHIHLSFQRLGDKQIMVKTSLVHMMCELRWKSPFYLKRTRTSSSPITIALKKCFIIVWTIRILTHSQKKISLFNTCESIQFH